MCVYGDACVAYLSHMNDNIIMMGFIDLDLSSSHKWLVLGDPPLSGDRLEGIHILLMVIERTTD